MLLSEDVKQRCNLNERDIISAATLPELDEAYTRRVSLIFLNVLLYNLNNESEFYEVLYFFRYTTSGLCKNYTNGVVASFI